MTESKSNNSGLYEHFQRGLEASRESAFQAEVPAPVTERIILATEDKLSSLAPSWQPVLAAWAGVGIVLVACLYLSKQPASYIEEIGANKAPILALKNTSPSIKDNAAGLDGESPSTFAQRKLSIQNKKNLGSTDGSASTLGDAITGEVVASSRLRKDLVQKENTRKSPSINFDQFPENRRVDTGFNASKNVAPSSGQSSLSSAASFRPSDERGRIAPPQPEPTPDQKERIVIRNNRLNPSLGEFMTLSIRMDEPGNLTIRIHNRQGELVITLVDQNLAKGIHEFTWGGTNSQGQVLASGIYFISIQTPGFRAEEKALILK